MGLLEDLLGAAVRATESAPPAPRQPHASGSAARNTLLTLLPLALALLTRRSRVAQPQAGGGPAMAGGGQGGLADILEGLLGGGPSGGKPATARGGGLDDLLSILRRAGFGQQVDSWVARGPNQPISPDAIGKTFGRDGLSTLARQVGLDDAAVSQGLAQLLPELVDHVTPDGRVPDAASLATSVEALARRIGV